MADPKQAQVDNIVDSAVSLGLALAQPRSLDGHNHPYMVVPNDAHIEDLSKFLDKPARARGALVALDVESFIRLVNADKSEATRLMFRGTDRPAFRAVLNAASAAAPDHGDHTVQYDCPLSDEWSTWIGADEKKMLQGDFAQFIEQNASDVVNPPSADMVEMSRTFEAKKNVDFKSGVRLNDGTVQFTYNETIEAKAGQSGAFAVPEQFTIAIPVFKTAAGEEKIRYSIIAKLRYKLDQKLVVWYELIKPDRVLENATGDVRQRIDEGTDLKSFNTMF